MQYCLFMVILCTTFYSRLLAFWILQCMYGLLNNVYDFYFLFLSLSLDHSL